MNYRGDSEGSSQATEGNAAVSTKNATFLPHVLRIYLTVLCSGSVGTSLFFPDKITHTAISSCSSEKKGWPRLVWRGALCPHSYLLLSFRFSHSSPLSVGTFLCGLFWKYLKKKKKQREVGLVLPSLCLRNQRIRLQRGLVLVLTLGEGNWSGGILIALAVCWEERVHPERSMGRGWAQLCLGS